MMKYIFGAIFFFIAAVVLVWLLSRGTRPATVERAPQGIAVYQSGVLGVVKVGPTCPVVRNPPDAACADKPYATTVTVKRAGSAATYATATTGADGAFHVALPPGSYDLSAAGGTPLPRCSTVTATVSAQGYVNADIMCDSGIR